MTRSHHARSRAILTVCFENLKWLLGYGKGSRGTRGHLSSILRFMPKEEMRDDNVEGFMASNSAAPPGPETFPLVCFRAFIIVSRSCRFNSSRVRSAASADGLGCCSVFWRAGEAGGCKVAGPPPPGECGPRPCFYVLS